MTTGCHIERASMRDARHVLTNMAPCVSITNLIRFTTRREEQTPHRSFVVESTVAQAIGNVALGSDNCCLWQRFERCGQQYCRGHRTNGNRLGHWKMVVGVIIVVHAAACSTVGLGSSYSNTGTGNAKVTAGAAVNFPTTDAVGEPGWTRSTSTGCTSTPGRHKHRSRRFGVERVTGKPLLPTSFVACLSSESGKSCQG